MALPAGVSTATLTVGVPVSFVGGPVRSVVSITPSVFLVHTATGTPLVNLIEEIATTDGVAGQFTLPHTDQSGFQDENGNAYENWYYTATIQYLTDKATLPSKSKVFQLVVGQTVVDLDLLPGGAPALPYIAPTAQVTSFGGRVNAVTLQESDLPTRLTDASLSATYVGLVQAAKNPDLLVAGAITLDASDQIVSAAVLWPDGTPGTLTITARHATGAVTNYNITYGSPVTKTFTQPTITRNANGAATDVPQIVVS